MIGWGGQEYPSISSFALHVLKTRNPDRRACDGWREVRLAGKRLEVFKHAWIHARIMAEHAARVAALEHAAPAPAAAAAGSSSSPAHAAPHAE